MLIFHHGFYPFDQIFYPHVSAVYSHPPPVVVDPVVCGEGSFLIEINNKKNKKTVAKYKNHRKLIIESLT